MFYCDVMFSALSRFDCVCVILKKKCLSLAERENEGDASMRSDERVRKSVAVERRNRTYGTVVD